MTPHERAAGALPPEDRSPRNAAPAGTASMHRAVPAPQPTAGAEAPELTVPAVTEGGWGASPNLDMAHWVMAGPIMDVWFGRPIALGLCDWNALVDDLGFEDGAKLAPCLTCSRALARLAAPAEQAQP